MKTQRAKLTTLKHAMTLAFTMPRGLFWKLCVPRANFYQRVEYLKAMYKEIEQMQISHKSRAVRKLFASVKFSIRRSGNILQRLIYKHDVQLLNGL